MIANAVLTRSQLGSSIITSGILDVNRDLNGTGRLADLFDYIGTLLNIGFADVPFEKHRVLGVQVLGKFHPVIHPHDAI